MTPPPITAPSLTTAAAVTAIIVGTVTTLAVRGFARRHGIVNHPNPIVPQHSRPVAYLGGVGIAAGAAAVLVPLMIWTHPPTSVARDFRLLGLCGLGFLLVGLADDLATFSAKTKLLLQLAVALIGVGAGVHHAIEGVTVVAWVIGVVWVVLVVNAFNVTDVCDGLVAGLSVVALTAVAIVDPGLRLMAATVAGATLGFLVFNRPPASIFLGDAGSHFLGFTVAGLGLAHLRDRPTPAAVGFGILIASVPLFEVGLLVVARRRQGLNVWRGSPDHFSLRLQARNHGRWYVDTLAWVVAAVASGFGIALFHVPLAVGAIGCATLGLAALIAGQALLSPEGIPGRTG